MRPVVAARAELEVGLPKEIVAESSLGIRLRHPRRSAAVLIAEGDAIDPDREGFSSSPHRR
jgi:hypothetical protein